MLGGLGLAMAKPFGAGCTGGVGGVWELVRCLWGLFGVLAGVQLFDGAVGVAGDWSGLSCRVLYPPAGVEPGGPCVLEALEQGAPEVFQGAPSSLGLVPPAVGGPRGVSVGLLLLKLLDLVVAWEWGRSWP